VPADTDNVPDQCCRCPAFAPIIAGKLKESASGFHPLTIIAALAGILAPGVVAGVALAGRLALARAALAMRDK
jgi:hypothetical protein